jgi:5-methylcytosine-specific restriction endonuclease McrA
MRKRHWSYQGERNRAIVLRRGYCELQLDEECTRRAETVDHIIPKSLGGPDIIENLRAACWHCNMSKGKRMDTPTQASLFSDGGYCVAPLHNISPNRRWTPLTTADYRGKP